MKRSLLFFMILSFAGMLFAYSKPEGVDKNLDSVIGNVVIYGNEPFTTVGFVTKDEKQYSLLAEKEILKELRKTQGRKIEIKGTIEKSENGSIDEMKDGAIIVLEWKYVK